MRLSKKNHSMILGLMGILFILVHYTPASACTSFAVYSDTVFYGMNFDYPDVEMRFTITRYNNTKFFQLGFINNNQFLAVCGMNDKGVFSTIQMLYPEVSSWPVKKYSDSNLYDVYINALHNEHDLQNTMVSLNASGKKILHINGGTFHSLYADKYGTAFVLEVGEQVNHVTAIKDDILVMTNFPVHEFTDMPLDQISGAGAARYKNAYKHIQAHFDFYNFILGFETLKTTMQTTGDAKTQCSMLFCPDNGTVFIALKRDFTKIWKVSIAHESIETYKGFDVYKTKVLNSSGISASDLIAVNQTQNNLPAGIKLYQNWPNPFNPFTHISYTLTEPSEVIMSVYDLRGVRVATLARERLQPGDYIASWDGHYGNGTAAPSGIYFYQLETRGALSTSTERKKMTLLR